MIVRAPAIDGFGVAAASAPRRRRPWAGAIRVPTVVVQQPLSEPMELAATSAGKPPGFFKQHGGKLIVGGVVLVGLWWLLGRKKHGPLGGTHGAE